jgi:hypothetical protein
MRLQYNDFLKMVHVPSMISGPKAYRLTVRNYCYPMSVKGLCPEKCTTCKASFYHVVSNLNVAQKPFALFIWRLREEFANAQEKRHVHKLPTPEMCQSVNPFKELMETLRTSTSSKEGKDIASPDWVIPSFLTG